MVYGSHNSLSGYKPLSWFKGILNFTSKCQSKTIKEQMYHNCRYFDIRLRKHKGKYYGAHGLMLYKITLEEFFEELINSAVEYNITDTIYFRVVHEDTFGKGKDTDMEEFKNDVFQTYMKYKKQYPMLYLLSITKKSNWNDTVIYNYIPYDGGSSWHYNSKEGLATKGFEIGNTKDCREPTLGEFYISRGYKWLFGLPFPKRAAKKLRYIVEKRKYNGISVIDFI